MTEEMPLDAYDPEMEAILQEMIDRDEDITARGVTRLHSKLSAASSIIRNPARAKLLGVYQAKQQDHRAWRRRLAKRSQDSSVMDLAAKDLRIAELERQVELLTASHVAMLRTVGELGGFAKWAQFFDTYQGIREDLARMGAMPAAKVLKMELADDR